MHDVEIPSPDGLPSVPRETEIAERPTGPSLRLLAPGGKVLVGMVRFQTRATGEFDKVTFYLDDKPVISKRRPPYSVELARQLVLQGRLAAPRRRQHAG